MTDFLPNPAVGVIASFDKKGMLVQPGRDHIQVKGWSMKASNCSLCISAQARTPIAGRPSR